MSKERIDSNSFPNMSRERSSRGRAKYGNPRGSFYFVCRPPKFIKKIDRQNPHFWQFRYINVHFWPRESIRRGRLTPPMLILTCFWFVKGRFKAIFNFLTNFWPSKSSIFLVYSHSRGVSHHFPPPLSSLPIGISHMSLRPTYHPPWTPLIRVGPAHIRASVTEEGFSLISIFISPGLGFSLKNRNSGAVFQFWEMTLRIEKRTIPGPFVWFLSRANAD